MRSFCIACLLIVIYSCDNSTDTEIPVVEITNYRLLSLGDSYTIGEGVCESCNFPTQLKDSLSSRLENSNVDLDIIAQTGWTTSNLISGISGSNLEGTYDLVSLLIGVNNQFKGQPFSVFETEFKELAEQSVLLANSDPSKVIVISIFDYSNTPFGNIFAGTNTTSEITQYNNYIKSYCEEQDMIFIDAQNLIFEGLQNPALIATDGLHPSEKAYSNLVKMLLPTALEILGN